MGEQDFFYAVNGKGNGCWGLRNYHNNNPTDLIAGEEGFAEGRQLFKSHLSYERNSKVIKLAKEQFKQLHNGRLFCENCCFDFHKAYGELGKNFIEGHHTLPVSELKEGSVTKVEDIVMVYAHCHRILHRKRLWLKKEDLKIIFKNIY